MPYGGAVWLKRDVVSHLLKIPVSQLIKDDYYERNKLLSLIGSTCSIYLAWDKGYDFRVIENTKNHYLHLLITRY